VDGERSRLNRIVRLARLTKLLRILKLVRIFQSIGDYLSTVPGLARIIAIVFLLFWMSHFLGCSAS
jgi:hypothetical protein